MKKNVAKIITMIMLVVSLIITVIMSIFTVLTGIVNKAIPPVVALLLVTIFFVWIDIFYLNCYKWLNHKTTEEKKIHNLKTKNIILIVIMSWLSFPMWVVLLVTVVLYRVFFEFQIYFLVVALVNVAYVINSILIHKAFAEAENVAKNAIDT